MSARGHAAASKPGATHALRASSVVALLALATTIPPSAGAQSACTARANDALRVASRQWPAPLDREVTLQGDNITLREGLARLATAARVRLSYVAELLPLDRPLCLAYRSVPAGQVLDDLLRGTQVEPVVAGDDQVVLAPARRMAVAAHDDETAFDERASMLDRVVVIGAAESAPDRSVPVAVAVIGRDKLARQESASLTHILDGSVPGLWMWQSSPTSLAARYGSVRGASSFGLSYPKIYIDGVEVANPLLVKQFDPSTIERIEVIRGPQGAALYGADAISGVINIVTRHDGVAANGQRLQLRSTAGVTGSEFSSEDVLTQQHGLTFRAGTAERSGGFGLNVTTLGAYIPGAFSRTISGNGGFRIVGTHAVFTGTARVHSENAGTPANPLLSALTPLASASVNPPQQQFRRDDERPGDEPRDPRSGAVVGRTGPTTSFAVVVPTLRDTAGTQSVRQYTIGTTLTVTPNDRWTHAFVLGVDGYRLRNPSVDNGPIPSPVDSALTASQGGSDRVTARVSSTVRFGALEFAAADLTLSAEHSAAREESLVRTMIAGGTVTPRPGDLHSQVDATLMGWRANSGVVAQANTSLRNWLFLTAGMRLERVESLVGLSHVAALPMIGGAVIGDRGDVTLKVRAAYGKGIRPVEGAIRELALGGHRTAVVTYDLEPEQQSGVEAGADLFIGRTFGLHVTRFDQRATGLIQSVAVAIPWARHGGPAINGSTATHVAYQLQNVGEIGNRGWELEGSAELGRLELTGTLSLVDSRVLRLANGYSGDLRPGDRMLDVPAKTVSLTGSWTGRRWFTSLSMSRAMDWTGYDRLAVAESLTSSDATPGELVGSDLRSFWREYDGVTRLRATFTRDLFRGLAFVMTGDNLLGRQRGEPDNITVVPGRTMSAGVKAKF